MPRRRYQVWISIRMRNLIVGILFIVFVGVGAVAFSFYRFLSVPASTEGPEQIVLVSRGSLHAISKMLEEKGLISSSRWFVIYGRLTGQSTSVRAGEYRLSSTMTPPQILGVITSGRSVSYPLTIPEGYSSYEIAGIFEQKGLTTREKFLSLVREPSFIKTLIGEDQVSLEGYLFPETYMFTKLSSPEEMIKEMVENSLRAYREIPEGGPGGHLTRHRLITLASIIEKETGVPEERGLVSSVFHNRLQKGMMLQTDPTVIYGIWFTTGVWPKNISRQDLLTKTPYNTYTFRGLPPGPISNPGKEAMKAARFPDESSFLYFVSKNDGTHTFTGNLIDHNKAVQSFQLNRKAREGKSWRDQSKKIKAGR